MSTFVTPSTISEADHGLMALAAAPVPPEEAAALLGELPEDPIQPVAAPAPGPVALPALGLSL